MCCPTTDVVDCNGDTGQRYRCKPNPSGKGAFFTNPISSAILKWCTHIFSYIGLGRILRRQILHGRPSQGVYRVRCWFPIGSRNRHMDCSPLLHPHPVKANGRVSTSYKGRLVTCSGRSGGWASTYYKQCYEYSFVNGWVLLGNLNVGRSVHFNLLVNWFSDCPLNLFSGWLPRSSSPTRARPMRSCTWPAERTTAPGRRTFVTTTALQLSCKPYI